MKCKKCDANHDGSFGSGKYCSRACANSRSRTDAVKRKISAGVLKSKFWISLDFKHNSNYNKIEKNKATWKSKRNYKTAHIVSLKKWLIEDRGHKCEECKVEQWNGKRLPMEVDHIDGNNKNNNIDNLKILCPNCHSQTPTWRKKKSLIK